MSLMAPKMDTFLGHIKDALKIDIPLEKVDTAEGPNCVYMRMKGDFLAAV